MRKLALIGVVALAGIFAASSLLAQDGGRRPRAAGDRPTSRPAGGPGMGLNADRIDTMVGGTLTEDQKTKINALAAERDKAMKEAMDKFQAGLTNVLTADQQAKMKEAAATRQGPGGRGGPRGGGEKAPGGDATK